MGFSVRSPQTLTPLAFKRGGLGQLLFACNFSVTISSAGQVKLSENFHHSAVHEVSSCVQNKENCELSSILSSLVPVHLSCFSVLNAVGASLHIQVV